MRIFKSPTYTAESWIGILKIANMQNYDEYLNSNLNLPNRYEMRIYIGKILQSIISTGFIKTDNNDKLELLLDYNKKYEDKQTEICNISKNIEYYCNCKDFARNMIFLYGSSELSEEEKRKLHEEIKILCKKIGISLESEIFLYWKKASENDVKKFSKEIEESYKKLKILSEESEKLFKEIKMLYEDIKPLFEENYSFNYSDDTISIMDKQNDCYYKISLKNWNLYFDDKLLCEVTPYGMLWNDRLETTTIAPLPLYVYKKSEIELSKTLGLYRERRQDQMHSGWLENKNKIVGPD